MSCGEVVQSLNAATKVFSSQTDDLTLYLSCGIKQQQIETMPNDWRRPNSKYGSCRVEGPFLDDLIKIYDVCLKIVNDEPILWTKQSLTDKIIQRLSKPFSRSLSLAAIVWCAFENCFTTSQSGVQRTTSYTESARNNQTCCSRWSSTRQTWLLLA